jgi:hypothetical protein
MTLLATSAWHYTMVTLEGRTAYKLMCGPLFWSMNQMLDPASLRFELKSLTLVAAEADPLSEVAYPPRADGPPAPRTATCAVHAVWETYGTGRLPSFFSLPTDLGGFELPTQAGAYTRPLFGSIYALSMG